jgi:hypothetical protein
VQLLSRWNTFFLSFLSYSYIWFFHDMISIISWVPLDSQSWIKRNFSVDLLS